MKRTISICLSLLAFGLAPIYAQATGPAMTCKIHGHVTSPTGADVTNGTVSLTNDNGATSRFTFPVASTGDFSGAAAPGTYALVYRAPETPKDKFVDLIPDVKLAMGTDTLQDIDMSRKEFIDNLTPEQKRELEEVKRSNSDVIKSNEAIKAINSDLKIVGQDLKDADAARATATQALGDKATKADIDAKAAEIKTEKYSDVQRLMLKDTAAKGDVSILWNQLGQAQLGLKNYDDAEVSFKKALALESRKGKGSPNVVGVADSGLGEVYARTGKVAEANAAYDAAAQASPTQGALFLRNEAVIFYQLGNADAQATVVEEALKLDPTMPILYYLKGQALVGKSALDEKTKKLIPPPGCLDAYQKYLELAPTGPFAAEIKSVIASFDQVIESSVNMKKKKK